MPTPDSIRILIVVLPIILMIIGIKKPVFAAAGYMIFVYANTSYYYPIFAQFKAELLFALIILARIVINVNSVRKLSFGYNKINLFMILFMLSMAWSYIFAFNYEVAWDYAIYHFIKTAILFYMVIMTLEDERDIKIFVWSFLLMFAYLAYEPTYGYITKTGADIQMYGEVYVAEVGLLSGHVALANNMNQMIPIAFFIIFSFQGKYKKALAAFPLIVFFVALVASASRGGVLGFLFFGATLVFFSKQRLKTGIISVLLLIVLFITSETLISTASRIDTDQTYGRFTGLTHGLIMIYNFGHIFGVGPGCFALARGAYFGHSMDSHNLYGQLFGELGIPGAIIWFIFMGYTFYNLITSRTLLREIGMDKSFLYYLATGLQISLIVRLFVSMGSHGLYYFYWYIVAALSAAILNEVKKIADANILLQEDGNNLNES